jgi:CBS domain-containing protein
MAAIDPVAYLRSTAPFHAVAQTAFDEAMRGLEVGFFPAGTRLAAADGEPLGHLYVIRRGAVRLERDGHTLQVLEEGEVFGYTSLITGAATMDVLVDEDLLAYRIPAAEFRALLADAAFARHFAVGLAERLKSSLEHAAPIGFQPSFSLDVQSLVARPPVWVAANATVADAARAMRSERVTSVLVRCDPPGIVTDRDFRNRVLADGLGPATPLARIATRPLRAVAASARLHEAWMMLLDDGVHHVPVERGGEIVGVLEDGDLLKSSAQGPVAVLRTVEQLPGRESLPGYAARLAEMAATLAAGGLDAPVIAGFVARLNDALLARIAEWCEAELGGAPAPYAWLAFGSEGRREQTLLTDQDNALVYADEADGGPARLWFQRFAQRVVDDLVTAGFPPCAGGRMGSRWNGTLAWWKDEIDDCVATRAQQAAIFFDLRRVAGALETAPLEAAVARAAKNHRFVRTLAREALALGPPATLRLRLGGESAVVDLKAHGISPIVYLARCYAAELGTHAKSTIERLDAARDAGLMAESVHAEVREAYRFLLGVRLRRQLRLLAEHQLPTSEVTLSELEPSERSRLKDAFRAIRSWQEKAAFHYQPDVV